eukprot:COSAG05_NODE_530_length_8907_cov_8.972298_8_plen_148_part_00
MAGSVAARRGGRAATAPLPDEECPLPVQWSTDLGISREAHSANVLSWCLLRREVVQGGVTTRSNSEPVGNPLTIAEAKVQFLPVVVKTSGKGDEVQASACVAFHWTPPPGEGPMELGSWPGESSERSCPNIASFMPGAYASFWRLEV